MVLTAPRELHNQMVMTFAGSLEADPALDSVFAALADPTRRAILKRLAVGSARVGDLAAPFTMSQPAISKHVRVLERAGLVARSTARQQPLRIETAPLAEATRWLVAFKDHWTGSLDHLDRLLGELQSFGGMNDGV